MSPKFSFSFIVLSLISVLCAARDSGGGATVELWCVAKNNAEDAALQSAIDWACGPGGATCGPIQTGGPCYDASDILRTASFAFNDYFLKHGMTDDSCNFANSAALTSLNPSHNGCKFPSSLSRSSGNFNGSITTGLGSASEDISSSTCTISSSIFVFIAINLLSATLLIL
ncbi:PLASMODESMATA CALLOSE-BINDING PROTEIN 5-like isoform X1 [Nicotiana tomentosiformis]|uniref:PLASMODESMATA CALLOSE-BINDING PROTEIN 5-like isoform X1 n=1 Tax=Nicotiana tomentosiformis TaxID=4098 RepID=UPI00051B8799|nr:PLASMODESMATA CALLOSE-BINDING PROTEIN 5-like isoform X1 [Nicotiana tomentosiformis]XP_009611924.1 PLASMODESMATA CALLOSE-BINDING PROTEIN 5-like isoform X1 [Nicotiana tomentosiformis]XP_009611925.1 PLASMODESMATA CALLOSE-BINDING PROTEIN 5-like isoform X1 [Nicotiana tomentosiformis]XP_009611926.1 PLASMODESMATA CALLOSE-BINDING PROTEIN 5-like isoform X1 [Nicotiana tomentosiformis]XP_009611927.1 PLASMODESMATA CALLOSE-BINDING PROTEIN 5-like isoform X1 [Nicotiana tomentosiformis]XP_033514355.1 PLASM